MGLYKTKINPTTGKLQLVPSGTIVVFKAGVANAAALPLVGNTLSDARITADTGHLYIWDGLAWVDQGDIIDIDWSSLTNKPSSSVSDIDDAVSKRHTQGTDQGLDIGGANAVTAAQTKTAYTHSQSSGNPHSTGIPDITGLQSDLNLLQMNIALNAFRLAVQGSLTLQKMIDGIVDEFEDETGIDTVNSVSQVYNVSNDYYSPGTIEDFLTGGTASADAIWGAGFEAAKAFDDDLDTRYWSNGTSAPHWVKYDLGVGVTKTSVKLRIRPYYEGGAGGAAIQDFIWQGSNTGSFSGEQTNIYSGTVTNADAWSEFTFANSTAYRYYRLYISNSYRGDGYTSIWEIESYEDTRTPGATENMELLSLSNTAEAVPTEGRIIIFEEDVDAVTENTDIKAWVSRDNGTTFTQITLTDEGTYDTGKRILAGTVSISAQPSGTSMKFKITTHNNTDQRIHGVGLFWK